MDDKGYLRPERLLAGAALWIPLMFILKALEAPKPSAETQRRDVMIHLHGPHDCICPVCGIVVPVEESVQCSRMDCPDCGTRMRALDIGEQRLEPLEVLGHSPSELPEGLALMEAALFMGEKATLTFCTEVLPTKEELNYIYDGMKAEGCHISKPTARLVKGIPTTQFVLRKGSPTWVLLIPILVPLFTIGLIAWGIAKIETISKAIVPIILILGGLLIVVAVVLREPAQKYLERGGRVPGLPATETKRLTSKKAVAVR